MLELEPPRTIGFSALPSPPAGLTAIPAEPAQLRYPQLTQEQLLCLFLPEKNPDTFTVQFLEEHPRKGVNLKE